MTSRIFAVAAAVLLSTPALADVREEERFSYTLESGGRLSLENVNGSISITGGSGDQVEIVAHKKADDQEALDEIEIRIDATASRISIDTELPNSKGWWGGNNKGASVSYELSVPSNIDLDGISSVNGGIDIRGVFGNIKAETVNGGIDVEDASADLKLETVNGSLDARMTSLTGDQRVNCDTVNGSINASDFGLKVDKGFVGKSLDGDIGGGNARVTANTVNGGVKLRKQ